MSISSEILGRGRVATVYNEGVIAVKRVRSDLSADVRQEAIQEFKKEIDILAKLDHRNIVKMVKFSLEPLTISMTLLNGMTLSDTMRDNFKSIDVKTCMTGVFRALAHLKEKKVTHADLTPRNVIYINGFGAVLIDFGKSSDHSQPAYKISGPTDAYRAPETMLFQKDNYPMDMWSAGVMFHRLIKDKERLLPLDTDCTSESAIHGKYLAMLEQRLDFKFSDEILTECYKRVPEICTAVFNKKVVYLKHFQSTAFYTKIIAEDAKHRLLLKMLNVDPSKRITPLDALSNPYFEVDSR